MGIFSKSMSADHGPDYLILVCATLLVLIGFIMLSSASAHLGEVDFGDSYFYIKQQFYNFLVGLVGFGLALKIPYRWYRGSVRSAIFFFLSLLLIGLVFTPLGLTLGGATRWVAIGPVSFQPSELLKLTLIIYLASWLSRDKRRRERIQEGLLPLLVVILLVAVPLFLQRSTSPIVILIAAALIMYFMSGAPIRYILSVVLLGVIGISLLIAISPYRLGRFLTFLNPEADPYGSGFHILQAKNAIGSGGLTGVGYGNSAVKYALPEPIGDSIFAVYAEEFGYLGSLFLIGLYAFLIIRMFILTRRVPDMFSRMLLIGFGSIIFIQTLFNIGAMSGFLPLTGTTLPLVSYGGTSLIVFMTMFGLVLNISTYARK